MAVTLKKQKIIDTYAVLIPDAQGLSEKFFSAVEQYLKDANMPNVIYERVEVVTRRALFGNRGRDNILVRHKSLHEFKMFISAHDYGNYLDVMWALTLSPGFLSRQASKMITGSGHGLTYFSLDLFDQQELDAYTVITHRAVTDTVKSIYEDLKQDFSKVNMRSRSGLSAW